MYLFWQNFAATNCGLFCHVAGDITEATTVVEVIGTQRRLNWQLSMKLMRRRRKALTVL